MALLDMCRKAQLPIIAAHVNYGKRDTSDRDMNGVVTYCEQYHIPCYVRYSPSCPGGNFQAFARDVRYDFFRELASEHNCAGVLVAHQLDDVLETYLMQRRRHSTPDYFGVKEEVFIKGVLVKRVLLGYTKKDLLDYCRDNKLTYFDDESNFTDDYERNRIRHAIVDSLSLEDKKKLLEEINSVNRERMFQNFLIDQMYKDWELENFSLKIYRGMSIDDKTLLLRKWFKEHGMKEELSGKALKNISDMIDTANHNWRYKLKDDLILVRSYDCLSLEENKDVSYTYTITSTEAMETPYFKIVDKGTRIQSLTVSDEDFPLTIRSVQKDDAILLRFGTKRINRWFIDRKIPPVQRKSWPVVQNAQGKVIFVAEIGCDIEHFSNNPNMFVIK